MLYWWSKYVLLGPLMRVLTRPTIEGLHHVPMRGGAILASNHLAVADRAQLGADLLGGRVEIGRVRLAVGPGEVEVGDGVDRHRVEVHVRHLDTDDAETDPPRREGALLRAADRLSDHEEVGRERRLERRRRQRRQMRERAVMDHVHALGINPEAIDQQRAAVL